MKRIISSILTVVVLTTQFSFADMKLVKELTGKGNEFGVKNHSILYVEFDKETEKYIKNFKTTAKTRDGKVIDVLNYVEALNLTYGGDVFDQENLTDKTTQCDGVSNLIGRLLAKTDVPYRFAIYGKYDKQWNRAGDTFHKNIQVKLEDGKWYTIEGTHALSGNSFEKDKMKPYVFDLNDTSNPIASRFSKKYECVSLGTVYVGEKDVDRRAKLYLFQ